MYHSLLHIFAIAKIDIQEISDNNISKKIIQRLCDILGISDFSDASNVIENIYKQINDIYQSVFNF
jgi:hypothetical protein